MRYYWYPGSFLFGFGGFLVLIWWFFLAWLIVSLLRFLFGGHHHHHHWRDKSQLSENNSDEALKILKQRYAKGEITKKEFDTIKKDLEL